MTAREVELTGGAPWGFRMHGGVDHNQPLRISRVNPGRKASLSGIREGDIISSINGRTTKSMSNADAHAMLRSAGPVLRLGLNENREMSPRRRSIGKSSELKRPSQLIAEVQAGKATPQAPVYATIRPSQLPPNRPSSLSAQSSLNSLPAESLLNSTPLVKSFATNDEPPRFHPTNPFYTTLPNYSSASKLPVPNGRASSIDRSKSRENTSSHNDHSSDLKSPSFFNKTIYSGPSSIHQTNSYKETGFTNGFDSGETKNGEKSENHIYDSKFSSYFQSVPGEVNNVGKNPFEPKRNSDPFEKYLRPQNKINGNSDYPSSAMTNSISDNNFHKNEEITKRSTITEHQISEVEEIKTVKKVILNGSGGSDYENEYSKILKPNVKAAESSTPNAEQEQPSPKVYNIPIYTDISREKSDYDERNHKRYSTEERGDTTPTAEASSSDVLTGKHQARSATAPAPISSPQKRSTAHNICRVDSKTKQPLPLRDICVQRIADLPYGEKILEELASVSERLQTINTHRLKTITSSKEEYKTENMPYYPLPDLSVIEKVSLPVKAKDPQPPPVKPRNSSLKKSQDDNHWTGVPTKTEPVYICLSPSQKMLMEKTNTIITKEDASQLVDIHKKYVDRRGYNEPNKNHHDNEKVNEPPFVPFKSQTGSRLLALIRDPSVTNISQASGDHNYSSEKIRNNYSDRETTFKDRIEDKRKFGDFTNSFKPIPPPRPKKYSSSFYESDESSDFTDNSLRSFKSERKYFHYSTGNLSKDIENDISSIQNMHRYYSNIRDSNIDPNKPRRPSLPKDICDQQMEYIRKKEKEVEAEIRRLEQEKITATSAPRRGPKAPLISEREVVTEKITDNSTYYARNKNVSMSTQPSEKLNNSKMSSLFSSSQEELLRDKMYSEYVNQMAERQERKQHKIIKITNPSASTSGKSVSRSMPAIDTLDSKVNNRIEKEFICKARERWNKLGITDPDTEDEREKNVYREPKVIEHKIKVIDGGEEKDVKKLPTHIQEFVNFTAKQKEQSSASSGESDGPASPHVVICAVIIVVLSIARYFIRLFRNI